MSAKIPKLFRSPVPERKYRKRVERRIFLETDRRFLRDITTTDSEGQVVLSRELNDEETKRLRTLVKKAKKNKGAVQRGKLVILLVLVAAVIVFNLVFRNLIAERTTEQLLERIFDAESEVTGMVFRPLAGTLQFDSMVVANRDAPLENLFELGTGRLDIDLWQALQGNIVINDFTVSELAFATAREQSGALPAADENTKPENEEGFSLDSIGLPQTLDPQAFLAQNIEVLETPELAEAFVRRSESFVAQSEREIDQTSEQAQQTFQAVSEFAQTDFSAVDDPQEAVRLYERSTELLATTNQTVTRVEQQVREIESELDALLAEARMLPASAAEDFDRLLALVPDISVDGPQFLRGLLEPILRDALGEWYDRISAGYQYFQRIETLRDGQDAGGPARWSTVVNYETTRYPVFLLEQAFFSASGDTEIEATVEEVSSDQSVNGSPTLLDYQMTRGRSATSVGALIDLREQAELNLALTMASEGLPVEITENLHVIGFERFSGLASVEVEYRSGAQTDGTATIEVSEPGFSTAGETTRIGSFVDDVVREAGLVQVTVGFEINENGELSLARTSTNLDQAFAGAIQEQIDATMTEFRTGLDAAVEATLAGDLQSVADQLDSLTGVEGSADALLARATEARELAESVVRRAEREVTSVRDAAREEAEEAVNEATESARDQAEDAVEDEVDRIRDRLPLPGF